MAREALARRNTFPHDRRGLQDAVRAAGRAGRAVERRAAPARGEDPGRADQAGAADRAQLGARRPRRRFGPRSPGWTRTARWPVLRAHRREGRDAGSPARRPSASSTPTRPNIASSCWSRRAKSTGSWPRSRRRRAWPPRPTPDQSARLRRDAAADCLTPNPPRLGTLSRAAGPGRFSRRYTGRRLHASGPPTRANWLAAHVGERWAAGTRGPTVRGAPRSARA